MAIETEAQYNAACNRINVLLKAVNNKSLKSDETMKELDVLSDDVADYEERNYPVKAPSLSEILRERMYEMGLSRTKLAKILHVSPSSLRGYLSGQKEPSLKVGREIHDKLGVDANVILGVS